MAEDLSQIIAGIRSTYDKTNLQKVDLEAYLSVRPEAKVGYLIQNMDPESNKDYAVNFDPVQQLFLDKLVNTEVLNHRINMDKNDFFRGIVFLDYLTTIILDDFRVLDDLDEIAKELEHRNLELDPDLNLVVRYTGIYYLSHAGREIVRERDDRRSRDRYNHKNKRYEPEQIILRKISPIYEALGTMVCNLAQNETIKQKLPDMLCLYDLKAAIFVDAILGNLQDTEMKGKIIGMVSDGDYYKASMLAINALSKEVSNSTLSECIDRMTSNGGSQ